MNHVDRARTSARLRWLVRFLDSAATIPGTNLSIGADAVLGLVPAVGDTLSAAAALYVVYEGRRLGARGPLMAKMIANVALDWLIGLVPVAGDVGDVLFRANVRNLALLENAGLLADAPAARMHQPSRAATREAHSQVDPEGRVNVRIRPAVA